MYRKSVMQEQEKIAQEQFLTRLGNIPVVNSAWTQAWGLYQKTKDSHTLIQKTLDMAETGIKTVADTTKPVIDKYQPQIEKVNSFACQQLDKLEENYPVIKKPTDVLIADGKEMMKPALDRVEAVKHTYQKGKEQVETVKKIGTDVVTGARDYGMMTVSKAMDTSYGHFVTDKVNTALTLSEEYLDKYLPEDGDNKDDEESDDDDDDTNKKEMDEYPPNPVVRAHDLTTKVRRRMYNRALKDLRSIHVRSQESLAKLSFTVDLIEYAKSNMGAAKDKVKDKMEDAQTKMSSLWTEINAEDEEEGVEVSDTMEGRSIIVARRLTRQIRMGVASINSYLPETLQPSAVRDRLKQTYTYTEDLYQYFKDVAKYEDVPSWVLTQAKDRMAYLQSTLGFLAETFVTVPLNWLSPEIDLRDIALEEPVLEPGSNGHIPNLHVDEHGRYVQGEGLQE